MRRRGRSGLSEPARVLLIAGAAIVVAGAFLYAGINAPNSVPGKSTYDVTAHLRDGSNLTPHAQVRVAGSLVGQVLHPRFEHGVATVDLQLVPSMRPLRADASLRVRPRSAVGTPYVDLVRGRSRRPLPAGAAIGEARTSSTVPIDTLLATFDPATRSRTRQLLGGLGRGVAGRGEDVNDLIGRMPPLLDDVRAAIAPLRADPSAVPSFIDGGASLFDALQPVARQAAGAFAPSARVFDAIDQRRPLQATLDVAPSSLSGLRRGLRRADPLLAAVDRFSVRALPLLRAAPASLHSVSRLLAATDAHVGQLRTTLLAARGAVSPTLALLRTTRHLGPTVEATMSAARPLVDALAPRYCDMIAFTRNWTSMMGTGNSAGNVLRLALVGGGFNTIAGFTQPAFKDPGRHINPYPAPCAATTTDKAR